MPNIELLNCDCIEFMKGLEDNAFSLAIVDPPYGINLNVNTGAQSGQQFGNAAAKKRTYLIKNWDKSIPNKDYFDELFRISNNQIIWGGNHMANYLPNKSGWIFWDKDNGNNDFSDGELAWTSFNKGLRKFKYTWNGMLQGNMKNKEIRIHPTQKPVALYKWLLNNYAKENDKILDTHGGSMSIAIACYDLGFDLTLCELDEDYYKAGKKRFEAHKAKYAPAKDIPITKNGEYKLF